MNVVSASEIARVCQDKRIVGVTAVDILLSQSVALVSPGVCSRQCLASCRAAVLIICEAGKEKDVCICMSRLSVDFHRRFVANVSHGYRHEIALSLRNKVIACFRRPTI